MERREVLRVMAMAAAASGFPGFSRWVFACDHRGTEPVQIKPAEYTPQSFSPAEYATVERLTEMIIPSDGSPGAREAGVAEFIDFMVWSDPNIQYRFRLGLAWLDAHSLKLHGKLFRELSHAEGTGILETLAYKKNYRAGEEDGREFFKLVREYTVMGFYTTRIGLEELGYPGLESVWASMPGCPHHDDPEHKHLPLPKV